MDSFRDKCPQRKYHQKRYNLNVVESRSPASYTIPVIPCLSWSVFLAVIISFQM